jgi:hypothetical protein
MRPQPKIYLGALFSYLVLLVPVGRAADQEAVDRAIQRGVVYLKQAGAAGKWTCNSHDAGATALAALTLLECDVLPADPILQQATAFLRTAARSEMATYDISLLLLYFDRLGNREDEELIRSLATRLLRGQNAAGGWSYVCPVEAAPSPGASALGLPAGGYTPPPRPGLINSSTGDNSNSQFALLALWVARRHQLPAADAALAAVAHRFRSTQNADGGWGYYPPPENPHSTTATMTCAGLLGLTVAYGVAGEAVLRTRLAPEKEGSAKKLRSPRDPGRDPAVRAALLTLGDLINGPYALAAKGTLGAPPGAPSLRQRPAAPGLAQPATGQTVDYYLLWSIERVAAAFSLRTLGRRDWFDWGSRIILANQRADGSWDAVYGPGIETSFALLFLRRSNLVKDLSNDLKDLIRDPAEVRLKAGGVGGKGLKGQDTPLDASAVGKADRKPPKSRPSSIPSLRPDPDADSAATRPAPGAPDSKLDPETAQLSAAVVRASGAEQEALIDQLRDARGVANTQALAAAIPQLSGTAKTRARDALAERLTRMTAGTLRDKFRDEDLEIRRAAALAVAIKNEQAFVPDLIELLADAEPPVARAAHAALKALTREDFGPSTDATRAERTDAIGKWKAWWASQKK